MCRKRKKRKYVRSKEGSICTPLLSQLGKIWVSSSFKPKSFRDEKIVAPD